MLLALARGRLVHFTLAAAFLLLAVGPLVDHHFHERFPGHAHLVATAHGADVPAHDHFYGSPHFHAGQAEQSDGVGILPAGGDALGEYVPLFTLVSALTLLAVVYGRLRPAAVLARIYVPAVYGGPLRPPPRLR
jgi:hypothetical protein